MNFPEKFTIQWIREHYNTNELTPLTLLEEIVRRAEASKDKNIWIIPPSLEFVKPYLDALYQHEVCTANPGGSCVQEKGPLWGIPFAVKDNIDMSGITTTVACPAYAYTAKDDATVIKKLLKAGAIPVGKTNMEQFATGTSGIRTPYGEVHNAYQPELITGGSSSGSAVSVAAGLVPFALGSDTGGSGRGPAALNALVGYKLPLGSWSGKGVVPCCLSLDTVSVLTNNLEDALLIDEIVRGPDPDFLYTRQFDKNAPKPPKKLLLPTNKPHFFGSWADIYESKWQSALKRIEKLGIPLGIADESIFEEGSKIFSEKSITAERWGHFEEFTNSNPGALLPITETVFRSVGTPNHTAVALFEDIHTLKRLKNQAEHMLKDCVFIWPTVGGTYTRDEIRDDPIIKNNQIGAYIYFCNPLDLCAVSLPENVDDKEYPFGITMYALPSSEDILCYAAEKFMSS